MFWSHIELEFYVLTFNVSCIIKRHHRPSPSLMLWVLNMKSYVALHPPTSACLHNRG